MISDLQRQLQDVDPRILTTEYMSVVHRVTELKGKFNALMGGPPTVVYMSREVWDIIKDPVIDKRKDRDELKEGATLVDRFEDLIIIKVKTDFRFLQVGTLVDSQLTDKPRVNTVPVRL